MEHCIFCSIINKDIPSHIIYEDEQVFAFLDIHPVNPGHVLVIPKKHESELFHLDNETYLAVMQTVKHISHIVERAMTPVRMGMSVIGFDVPHAHVHLVPLCEPGDIAFKLAVTGTSKEELEAVANQLKQEIS